MAEFSSEKFMVTCSMNTAREWPPSSPLGWHPWQRVRRSRLVDIALRMHVYEVRPRKDKRGVDLISDALPFGRLWYDTPDHAIGYAMHSSRSHDAVICVYDDAGNVIETRARVADFDLGTQQNMESYA
jgi:hypothetical protein